MEKRDIFRFTPGQIVMSVSILFLSSVLGGFFAIDAYMNSQIEYEKKVLAKEKEKYEKTVYIEKNIEEFYNSISKSREFASVSMYTLKSDFSYLIPSNVKVEALELNKDSGKIIGKATDYRTVDFVGNTLKTFSTLYGSIYDVTVLNSSKTSQTNVNFQITFKINTEQLKSKIYSNDIDGDGVLDFREEEVNNGGIKEKKKIVNDECPFTPVYFVIGRMLEQNPSLVDVYPKYNQMYQEGFFTLKEDGCLTKGDYSILQ